MAKEYVTTYELEQEKKTSERIVIREQTTVETMEIGICKKVETRLQDLEKTAIDIADIRMLKVELETVLEAYDAKANNLQLFRKRLEEINDELYKRKKELADKKHVEDLRAEADALEKRIEEEHDNETI